MTSLKITSVQTTTQPTRRTSRDTGWVAMAAARQQWAAELAQLGTAPWAACPAALVRSFVQAMASDLRAEWGDDARQAATMNLAMTIAQQPTPAATFTVAAGAARLDLTFRAAPEDEDQRLAPEFAMEVEAEGAHSEDDIRQALGAGDFAPAAPKLAFLPFEHLPDDALMSLVQQIEGVEKPGSQLVLVSTVAVLQEWEYASARNARHIQHSWSGLSQGDTPVLEGQTLVMEMTQHDWDSTLGVPAPAVEPETVTQATVRLRHH